jgi:hypothetical protein
LASGGKELIEGELFLRTLFGNAVFEEEAQSEDFKVSEVEAEQGNKVKT